MTRWKATGIHLLLSVLVIALIAAVLIYSWYGWPLFELMGALKLLTILAVVNIVAGPLLTMVVFKSGKPSLKFDLIVIVLLQIGFLAYGLHMMASSRPVFLVGLVDRFELVFANQLAAEDLAEGARPEYRRLSWTGPVLVGGRLGQTSRERLELAMSGFAGQDIHLLPKQYTDYTEVQQKLLTKAEPAQKLADTSPQARAILERHAQALKRPMSELATLPIISRRARATMLLDAKSGEILGPVALDPWPDTPVPVL